MNLPIELPVWIYKDGDQELYNLGIKDQEDLDPDVDTWTFYKIDVIRPYYYKDRVASMIYSGGIEFICNLTYEDLRFRLEL